MKDSQNRSKQNIQNFSRYKYLMKPRLDDIERNLFIERENEMKQFIQNESS